MDMILKILREKERTQAWLARQLGVSRATVTYWVQGKLPVSESRKIEMAKIFQFPVDLLFPDG